MRVFSVEEANALLPFLRKALAHIAEEQRALRRLAPEIQPAQERAQFGGGSEFGAVFLRHLIRFHQYAQEIASHGVVVKDYELGLCDFPFYLHGQLVYLCWKLGEARIHWWHEPDAGFAGRQPLD